MSPYYSNNQLTDYSCKNINWTTEKEPLRLLEAMTNVDCVGWPYSYFVNGPNAATLAEQRDLLLLATQRRPLESEEKCQPCQIESPSRFYIKQNYVLLV